MCEHPSTASQHLLACENCHGQTLHRTSARLRFKQPCHSTDRGLYRLRCTRRPQCVHCDQAPQFRHADPSTRAISDPGHAQIHRSSRDKAFGFWRPGGNMHHVCGHGLALCDPQRPVDRRLDSHPYKLYHPGDGRSENTTVLPQLKRDLVKQRTCLGHPMYHRDQHEGHLQRLPR
jgi:hypothetical protein